MLTVSFYSEYICLHFMRMLIEFIAFARNLCEDVTLDEGKKWTAITAGDVPLESDEIILEYLCRHNYDVALAKFNLTCKLGAGKGLILEFNLFT